jgi:transposase
MYQYSHIIIQLRNGNSIRALSKAKLADRKKLRKIKEIAEAQGWLDSKNPMPDDGVLARFFKKTKSSQKSLLDPHKTKIEDWVQQGVQATTIHAHLLREHGFQGSYNVTQRYIKELKHKLIPATTILDFKPGETAQVDFGFGPKLIDESTGEEVKTWIFVMVLSWSRHMYAEIVLRQDVETWLGCHRRAFEWFNGAPAKIIIDNAKCAITKACYHDPVVQRAYAEFAQGYGFIISPCPPYDPQKKGRVESGVKYVKNRFVPLREFRGLVDANQQLKNWVSAEAGNRIHGSTREKPLVLFEIEKPLLKELPDNPPELAVWEKVKLHGDCHVQYLKCRYSGPYRFVRQELWLRATETTVRLYLQHELIALHPRLWNPGTKNTLQEHLPPNAFAYQMKDAQWCLKQANAIGLFCTEAIQTLLNDSVVDYLRAAQSILGLQKKHGMARLEAACRRAIAFQSVHYRTIKSILESGVEQDSLPDEEICDALAETYTSGGRFCRNTSHLLN